VKYSAERKAIDVKRYSRMTRLALIAIALGASFVPSASSITAPVPTARVNRPRLEVIWKGKRFYQGDRVLVTSWAGTIKPEESGHPAELNLEKGNIGTVIRGERRQPSSYSTPDPNEPIQILRVRWDKQSWTENETRKIVKLDEFETTVHADYLRVIRRSK
jgi:hypothetical protein